MLSITLKKFTIKLEIVKGQYTYDNQGKLDMEIVAGLNLVSIKPKVWDEFSDYYLRQLGAVMVSYAEFHRNSTLRQRSMDDGLHASLGIPKRVKIYLDNGAFRFSRAGGEVPREEYRAFVKEAKPDWHVIPQDYIPVPQMSDYKQNKCLEKTMEVNQEFSYDGYVSILHVSRRLNKYIRLFDADEKLRKKTKFCHRWNCPKSPTCS